MEIIVTFVQEIFYDSISKFLHAKTGSKGLAIVGGVLLSLSAALAVIGLMVVCLWAVFGKK